jgi:outer membrane receptor protein involved in Fe transport
MSSRFALAAVLLAAFSITTPALAQRTTGSLSGTVTDGTGGVLPGVSVTLRGPAIAGTESATTNAQGVFRFVSLPVGRYEVTYRLAGFRMLIRSDVRVSVGATTEESPSLAVGAPGEEVTVVAESRTVDTTSNELQTNYGREWLDDAPVGRLGFFEVASLAPGAVQPGEGAQSTQVFGSSQDENLFQLDGTDITDNFFGNALAAPNLDAIEEVEILSLGAPAEYGNVTGAVYNIVTRQGGNEFHGGLSYLNQSDALTGRNTTAAEECFGDEGCLAAGGFPFHRSKYHDLSAQLGGPLVKDKLWFFVSAQLQRDGTATTGVDPVYGTTNGYQRYLGKLNWQLGPGHRLQANLHHDDYDQPYGTYPGAELATRVTRRGKTPTPGLAYTGTLSPNTTIDVRYSGFYGTTTVLPTDPADPRDETRYYDFDSGTTRGGYTFWYELESRRTTLAVKVSHYAEEFLGGSHDFRFGVQYSRASAGGIYGYNDLVYTYLLDGELQGYGYERSPFSYEGDTAGAGVYLDDTFKVNDRLTLNLGLRYDHNRAYSAAQDELDESGQPTGVRFPRADYYTWKPWSPRLGFNLRLDGRGRTALKGHYGRYHRAITTADFANIVGPSIKPIYYGLYDPDRDALYDLVQISSNENLSVDPRYRSPYTDQLTLSLEREIVSGLSGQLSYVKKRGRDYGGWVDVGGVYETVEYLDDQGAGASGRAIPVQQLQNSRDELSFQIRNRDDVRTDVDAVSLNLLRRMSGRWQLNASLTWLRARGRLPSSIYGSSPWQSGGLQFSTFGRDPNDFVNTYGRLPGDIAWTGKLQLLYDLPWDLRASLSYRYRSGANRDRTVRVEETNLSSTIFAEQRGTLGRLDSIHVLDVRLAKDFRFGRKLRVGVTADLFNALNTGVAEGVWTTLGTSDLFDVPYGFVLPRRAMVGGRVRF